VEQTYARELEEEIYRVAQSTAEPTHLLAAHAVLGQTLSFLGDYAAARTHLEHGIALIDPTAERTLVRSHGFTPGVMCLAYTSWALWSLGFPVQAVEHAQEALALAQALAHPLSLAMAQQWVAGLSMPPPRAPDGPEAGRRPAEPGDGAGVSGV